MTAMQFHVSVAVVPTVTIIVVLIGVSLNNANLNARLGDLRAEIDGRFNDMNDRMSDLRNMLRAEMAKNHSEAMIKFAELDARLSRLEAGLP